MTDAPMPTFDVVFKRFVKRVLHYWSPITVMLAFTSTTFSMLTLYVFTKAIGRVDMFVPALDSKAALTAWLLGIVPIMIGYLILLTSTNWLYGTTVSMFARSGVSLRRVALYLLVPIVAGFVVFCALAFREPGKLGPGLSIVIICVSTLLGYALLFYSTKLGQMIDACVSPQLRAERPVVIGAIGVFLVATVISAIFPISLIIRTYVGEDTDEAVIFVAFFSFFTLVLSLAPTLVFFVSNGSMYRRLVLGLIVMGVLFFGFLLGARGTMSSITYAAAGKLELRQSTPARFVLGNHVALSDIDNLLWKTRVVKGGRIEVQGYQLFSFGDALLICPSSLLAAQLHQLPRYTSLCILSSKDKVDRKPRKSGPRRFNSELAWRAQADRLASGVIQSSIGER